MARALDAVTPERGAGHGISSPIVGGAINLYQVGEWATAHVIRHNKQAKQVLGTIEGDECPAWALPVQCWTAPTSQSRRVSSIPQ